MYQRVAVLFRSTCDLDRVVTSWRDERGAVVDMASRQTHSSVLTTINTCSLTSLCISHDVFDPEKRQWKLLTWRYFAKHDGHSILPMKVWIDQGWFDLASYSRPPPAKISHKRISDSSSRNAARLLTQGVPFSCLICKQMLTYVCLWVGITFFYCRCISFLSPRFLCHPVFVSFKGGQCCWCLVVFCPLLLATDLKVKLCPVAAYHCILC